jgi:hypothetical protein
LNRHKNHCKEINADIRVHSLELELQKVKNILVEKNKSILELKNQINILQKKMQEDKKIIEELKIPIISLESENKTLKSLGFNNSWYNEYFELQNAYRDLVNKYVRNSQDKISLLNKKYVKRQPRTKYEGNNFIYIVTTPSLKQERRYILGKAVDLTNRLSTYNKTDEHEVIYYCCCPCKSTMGIVENLVFNKLGNYRERANRERFILPEDQNIILFSEVIRKCVNFVKESL